MSLADMTPGTYGIVTGFDREAQMRRRLQDLGLINGTKVECISKSPMGDPTAFLIRRAVIALRKEDACQVYIKEVGECSK